MRRTTLTLFTLTLIAVPLTADAEYRYLCTSVPGACEYTPANVPKLLADVCYNPTSSAIRVKGTAPCPTAHQGVHGDLRGGCGSPDG